jgi:nitrate reductase molybdenum cofactor assembly chaperone NarJ/NarW
MNLTFKALAALLAYPTPELIAALPEIDAVIGDARGLRTAQKAALGELTAALATADLIDAQERYVEVFDRGRRTSLHLFEHVHGDSRDRGQAMVELKKVYADAGFAMSGNELPDYLPAMLEFLSHQPQASAVDMLGDCAHILRKVGEALQDRRSPYSAVLAAVLALVGEAGLAPPRHDARAEPEKPLDDEWREDPVYFGPPGGQGCGASAPSPSVVRFTPRQP